MTKKPTGSIDELRKIWAAISHSSNALSLETEKQLTNLTKKDPSAFINQNGTLGLSSRLIIIRSFLNNNNNNPRRMGFYEDAVIYQFERNQKVIYNYYSDFDANTKISNKVKNDILNIQKNFQLNNVLTYSINDIHKKIICDYVSKFSKNSVSPDNLFNEDRNSIAFSGENAIDNFVRYLNTGRTSVQVLASQAHFFDDGFARQHLLNSLLNAISESDASDNDGADSKSKPNKQKPIFINVHAQDSWFDLTALAGRISSELEKRGEVRPVLILPIARHGLPAPTLLKKDDNEPDRSFTSFVHVVGYLKHFFDFGLDGIETADPYKENAEAIEPIIHRLRWQLVKRPSIIMFVGVHVPNGDKKVTSMEQFISDDIVSQLIYKLLDPPFCSILQENLVSSTGNSQDNDIDIPDIIQDFRRNRIIVFSDNEMPEIDEIRPLIRNTDLFRFPLPSPVEDVYDRVLTDINLKNIEIIKECKNRFTPLNRYYNNTFYLLLDNLISFNNSNSSENNENWQSATSMLEEYIDYFNLRNDYFINSIIRIMVQKINQKNRNWLVFLFLLSITPDGLRVETLTRFVKRARNLVDKNIFSHYPLFSDSQNKEKKCINIGNLDIHIKEELRNLIDTFSCFIGFGGQDYISIIHDFPHLLELDNESTQLNSKSNSCRHTPENGSTNDESGMFPSAICFILPELRTVFRDEISKIIPKEIFHVSHRLLSEEAIQQQTIILRHSDSVTFQSIRSWRRLFAAMYHGLQGIPLNLNNLETFGRNENNYKLLPNSMGPGDPYDFWKWLYHFCYRAMLEQIPDWNLSRYYGTYSLKLEALLLFDRPWSVWPEVYVGSIHADRSLFSLYIHDNVKIDRETRIKKFEILFDYTYSRINTRLSVDDFSAALVDIKNFCRNYFKNENEEADPYKKKIFKKYLEFSNLYGSKLYSDSEFFRKDIETWNKRLECLTIQKNDKTLSLIIEDSRKIENFFHLNQEINISKLDVNAININDILNYFDGLGNYKIISDILFRIAEMVAIFIFNNNKEFDSKKINFEKYYKNDGINLKFLFGDFLIDESMRAKSIESQLESISISFVLFCLAERIRRHSFENDPTSKEYYISAHSTRAFIRVIIRLQEIRKIKYNEECNESPEDKRKAEFEELLDGRIDLGRHARRLADKMARHLFRFPRERASMLILESAMLRTFGSASDEKRRLLDALKFLADAEPVVLNLESSTRMKLGLALERSLVLEMLMKHYRGNDQILKQMVFSDVSYLFESSRDKNNEYFWKKVSMERKEQLNRI